jgi:hypothetical protein
MKLKTYDGWTQRLLRSFEENADFASFDHWACTRLRPLGLRWWWHRLWVRKSHDHPSYNFDREIHDHLQRDPRHWEVGSPVKWSDIDLVWRRSFALAPVVDYSGETIVLRPEHIRGLPHVRKDTQIRLSFP